MSGSNFTLKKLSVFINASLFSTLSFSPLFSSIALAGPNGGQIVGGSGQINQSALNTTINQHSNRLAIDWQSFNVNQNESVNFNQPGRAAIALNRILDQNASQIHGSINANGQVVLVNPNGVFFGKNSSVNAGGLFAAALDVNAQDFMQGRLDFKALQNTSGLVVNEGRLEVIDGGTLALLGQRVENKGMLVANLGTVALAAGHDISVHFDDYEHFSITINQNELADILQLEDPAVLNSGLIQAHNGNVVLTARQADAIKSSINQIDKQQAFSFTQGQVIEKDGVVYFTGPDGDISDLGEVDVSGEQYAGNVLYSGENINHSGSIKADAETGQAGTVKFNANDTILLTGNSQISAQSKGNTEQNTHSDNKGGTVHLLAQRVGLTDKASINVSGDQGGGEVLLGGDYQGENPEIKNAEAVYLGEDTAIHADAIKAGNGGKIIVWSDKASRVYGTLTAKGGEQAGDGGFIETSSRDYVDLLPTIDVSAVNGQHGEWLIDPSVLTINNLGNSNRSGGALGPVFASTDNISNLSIGTLEGALQNGADITVQTSVTLDTVPSPCGGGGEPACTDITPESLQVGGQTYFYGDLILESDLDIDNIGTNRSGVDNASTLTLRAHRDVVINGAIGDSDGDNGGFTNDGDILNLVLQANISDDCSIGSCDTNLGSVRINNNIDLQGGDFTATGRTYEQAVGTTVDTTIPSPTVNTGFDPDTVFGMVGAPTPGGDVNINVDGGDININGDMQIAGNHDLTASNGAINGAGNMTVAGTSTFNANNNILINGSLNSTGDINLTAGGSITGSGNITAAAATNLDAATNIDLNNNANNFGTVDINNGTTVRLADANDITVDINNVSVTSIATNTQGTGNAIINDADIAGTDLAAMNVGGNLTVTAGGNISDSGDIVVGGLTTLTVPDNSSVILDSAGNNFDANALGNDLNIIATTLSTLTVVDTSAFQLQDGINVTGDINLRGASLLTNNFTLGAASTLTLTATAGDIDQNNAISHAGSTVLDATGDINLNTQNNNLANVTITQATNANINNDTNSIALDGVTATNLNVIATGGITDGSSNNFINVSGTTTLDAGASNIAFNNLVFNGPDYTASDLNDLVITNANQVLVYDENSLNISGTMSQLDVIAGLDNVAGANINNTTGGTLAVSGVTRLDFLNSGAIDLTIGAVQSNMQGNVSISNVVGNVTDVTINNIANLQMDTLGISNGGTGSLNLRSDGVISQTGAISVDGNTTLQANTVNLNTGSNDFNTVTLNATPSATIADTNNIILTSSGSGTVTVNATNNITLEGDYVSLNATSTSGNIDSGASTLTVSGNTVLSTAATADVDFQTNQVDLNTLSVAMVNNISIDDANALTVSSATVNGLMDIDAAGAVSVTGDIANLDVNTNNTVSLSGNMGIANIVTTTGGVQNAASALSVVDTLSIDAASSDVTLSNAANNIARLEVSNAQNIDVVNNGAIQLRTVNSNTLDLNTTGNISQQAGTVITVSGDTTLDAANGDITLQQANQFNTLTIASANNASLSNDQSLILNNSSATNNMTIATTTGDLSLNQVNVGNSASFTAADRLIDNNADATNIIAATTSLTAANGIGTVGAVGTRDIDLQTSTLSAQNSNSGDINLKNSGSDITLANIVNDAVDTGNFNFETTGDVLIDRIVLQQNLTEDFFSNGTGTVNMRTANGSFLGVGTQDLSNPDITATNLRLIGVRGTLGTLQRPLVLNISGKVELLMRASLNPVFIDPVPDPELDIRDDSILQFTSADTLSAVNGVQLTEVETLLDIDPAIFTDIRHFVIDADPVLLPRDQRFDVENEDEGEDDEYFRRITGENQILEN